MIISEREAAKRLYMVAALTRTPARRLLRTGIAGDAPYELEKVDEVGLRRIPDDATLRAAAPLGLLQLRLSPHEEWHTSWSLERKLAGMAEHPPTAFLRLVQLVGLVKREGPLPMIATISGFVVGGADLVEPVVREGRLVLAEPGQWFECLGGARWWSRRGGAPLQWYDARFWHERAS